MLFGKLPSCVKTRQQPTSGLTLRGLLSLQQQAAEKLSVPLKLLITHPLSALPAPREESWTTKTLPVADAMKILPRGWACRKKRDSVTKICTSGLLGWGSNTLHPVMSSECCGTLSAQREKGTSEGSSDARKSLVISANVYGCLNLYGTYEQWKKAGGIFILLSCRDLIHTHLELQTSPSFHVSVKRSRFCKELSLGALNRSLQGSTSLSG